MSYDVDMAQLAHLVMLIRPQPGWTLSRVRTLMLVALAAGEPVSKQTVADRLGLSRSSAWAHLEGLRKARVVEVVSASAGRRGHAYAINADIGQWLVSWPDSVHKVRDEVLVARPIAGPQAVLVDGLMGGQRRSVVDRSEPGHKRQIRRLVVTQEPDHKQPVVDRSEPVHKLDGALSSSATGESADVNSSATGATAAGVDIDRVQLARARRAIMGAAVEVNGRKFIGRGTQENRVVALVLEFGADLIERMLSERYEGDHGVPALLDWLEDAFRAGAHLQAAPEPPPPPAPVEYFEADEADPVEVEANLDRLDEVKQHLRKRQAM